MNKRALVDAVATRAGLSRAEAARAVDALFDAISAALARGDPVRLSGFGTFTASTREARTGRNPRTGQPVAISEAMRPRFVAARALRDAVSRLSEEYEWTDDPGEFPAAEAGSEDSDEDDDDAWGGPRIES